MPKKSSATTKSIYQLRISLLGTDPEIWRTIQVPGGTKFSNLHNVIQIAMGWENAHLYHFIVDKQFICPDESAQDGEAIKSSKVVLQDVASRTGHKLQYEYDFGDSWEHEIVVEQLLAPEKGASYPRCIAGERACPPEDCGGTWGYERVLGALKDRENPDYAEVLEWLGDGYDPEKFDMAEVDTRLKNI
jgi:hypothetical protein